MLGMTRSQALSGSAAIDKPAATQELLGRRRANGGRVRRADPDAKVPEAGTCSWKSSAKPKEAATDARANTSDASIGPRQGWAELPAVERASRCAQLQEMGFTNSVARIALEDCGWDVNKALDRLFNSAAESATVSVPPQTIAHNKQSSCQRAGVVTKTTPHAAKTKLVPKARDMDATKGTRHCAEGDSTSASGFSTPRLATCPPSSCGDDTTSPPPALPPGLDHAPRMLAAPPGLDIVTDEPTPCLSSKIALAESRSIPTFQAQDLVVPPALASQVGALSLVPKRSLQKVQHTWHCEDPSTQLSVEEGTFVHAWTDTTTSTGWVYAESLICCSRAGWLPESMLQQMPPGRLWMRITTACSATAPMQLQVEVGNMVMVDASQEHFNGWVYAEQAASATGQPGLQGLLGTAGWVPIQCVKSCEV